MPIDPSKAVNAIAGKTLIRPLGIGRFAVRAIRASMTRSQIWFAAPALLATKPVANSNQNISTIDPKPPPPMIPVMIVVIKIITTIRGLVSWTKSLITFEPTSLFVFAASLSCALLLGLVITAGDTDGAGELSARSTSADIQVDLLKGGYLVVTVWFTFNKFAK